MKNFIRRVFRKLFVRIEREFVPCIFAADSDSSIKYANRNGSYPYNLLPTCKIKAEFVLPSGSVTELFFFMATHRKVHTSTFRVQVFKGANGGKSLIAESEINMSCVKDLSVVSLQFDTVLGKEGDLVTLLLSSPDSTDNEYFAVVGNWKKDSSNFEKNVNHSDIHDDRELTLLVPFEFTPQYVGLCVESTLRGFEFGWEPTPEERMLVSVSHNWAPLNFRCPEDGLTQISITFSIGGKKNDAVVEWELAGKGRVYGSGKIEVGHIPQGKSAVLEFSPIEKSRDENFMLRIKRVEASKECAISIWGSGSRGEPRASNTSVNYTRRRELLDRFTNVPKIRADSPSVRRLAAAEEPHYKIAFIKGSELLQQTEIVAKQLNDAGFNLEILELSQFDRILEKLLSHEAVVFTDCAWDDPSQRLFRTCRYAHIPVFSTPSDDKFSKYADSTLPASKNEFRNFLKSFRRLCFPKISIVTVLYAKEKEVRFFLEALARQNYRGEIEAVFVDDCTPDRSVDVVRAFEKENRTATLSFKILKNEENIGNCASRNVGIRAASGEIVVIIDADCLLNRDFLFCHAEMHRKGDFDVVIGPMNLESEYLPPLDALSLYEGSPYSVEEIAMLQDVYSKPSFLNCITRNFSIRKSFITEDLFDTDFSYSKKADTGFGWEDVEMGYRLYKKHVRIGYCPDAFSVHVTHASSVDESSKPARSLKNFRKLITKHPELVLVARRWVHETFGRIAAWFDRYGIPANEDRMALENELSASKKVSAPRYAPKPLRILSYRWHCAHQYEIYKLPHTFTLVEGFGPPFTGYWSYDQRPFRDNVRFIPRDGIDERDYDVAILHFDENSLAPENTNGVLEKEWGEAFQWYATHLSLPKVAICHGTPQFYGQYNPNYTGTNFGEVIEEERKKLVEYLSKILVICNSHQARREWNFMKSKTIWQGFDPVEYPQTDYRGGVLSLGRPMYERPHYRGLKFYEAVVEGLPQEMKPGSLSVSEPGPWYQASTNPFAWVKYRNYVNAIRKHSIYFNPTLRSPMPRSRGEAMMCGLVTVSAKNHDVDMFIQNGVNGLCSDDPREVQDFIKFLMKDRKALLAMGQKSRETSLDLFNHDRFLSMWQETLRDL